MEVIEVMNRNYELMKPDERKLVISSLKGIYEGTKQVMLNYGQLTDHGVEILSESLKFNTAITKIDFNTNKISDLGL